MVDYEEQIKDIEAEMSKTQKNKATEHHLGLLKAKIAILRQRHEARSKKTAGEGFAVRKSGDASASLVGFPSVGKSTILNRLTNAASRTAAYSFTTLTCIPGILKHNSAQIQILDIPGIIKGAAGGAGKGKEVLAVIRSSDLVIIVVDITDLKQEDAIRRELYEANIRLDEEPPKISIKPGVKGGLHVATLKKLTKIDKKTIEGILKEYKIVNGYVTVKEDITVERLIDALEGNRTFIPSLLVFNKADLVDHKIAEKLSAEKNAIAISAENDKSFELLKQTIYDRLKLIRIYLKEYGKKTDDDPLIMRTGTTVGDVCRKLHRDFVAKFRYVKIWGKTAKFPGEKFQKLELELHDKDIVEIKLR